MAPPGRNGPKKPDDQQADFPPVRLTESQWKRVQAVLPVTRTTGRGRPRECDLRDVVDAIRYREQIGCGWRSLPTWAPHWQTVRLYAVTWEADGTWAAVQEAIAGGC